METSSYAAYLYKCRLCGKVFKDGSESSIDRAEKSACSLVAIDRDVYEERGGAIYKKAMHYKCKHRDGKDKCVGMGDLAGYAIKQ